MLERAGYRLLETHKNVHRGFIEKLRQLLNQYRNGTESAGALQGLLETWLFSHIRVHDKGYVSTVKSAGAETP